MTDIATITPITIQKHSWMGEQKYSALDSVSHCEETWRGCEKCGLIKITVHPPHEFPYRVWRFLDGRRVTEGATPQCNPEVRAQ